MKSTCTFLLAVLAIVPCCRAQSPAAASGAPAGTRAGLDAITEARANLKAAEAAHPGNSKEICDALEALIGLQLDGRLVTDETMALVQHEVAVAEAGPGTHSKEYAAAVGELAEVLVAFDRPGEARPYAEKALDLGAQIFPDTTDFADAAEEVGTVCDALGDFACSLRSYRLAVATERKVKSDDPFELVGSLSNLASALDKVGDHPAAIAALKEALAYGYEKAPNDPHMSIIENNLGSSFP